MTQTHLQSIAPFFIVADIPQATAFYRDRLAFEVRFLAPDANPFFAIVGRDDVQIYLKSEQNLAPMPNPLRHPAMRWDAFISTPEPDALAAELTERGVPFSVPLMDTHDGLHGFELRDADGYVLFFGRPQSIDKRAPIAHR